MPEESDLEYSPVTFDHLLPFGMIINIFARLEAQMQIAVAGLAGTTFMNAVIMTADLQHRQRRILLRNLRAVNPLPKGKGAEIEAILNRIDKYAGLRNWIAHAIWVPGHRKNSIKPMQLKTKSGKPQPLGHRHNERDWTVGELADTVNYLEDTFRMFRAFLQTPPFAAISAAESMDVTSKLISNSPGTPRSK